MSDSATPWTTACQTSLSVTNSLSLPKLMSTESVMPSSHLILCCPLLLLPLIFPSTRVFSSESALYIRWPAGVGIWSVSWWNTSKFQLNYQSFQWTLRTDLPEDGLVGSPGSARESQESSPTPQFKSINCLALSLLYRSTFTAIHDHWKKT